MSGRVVGYAPRQMNLFLNLTSPCMIYGGRNIVPDVLTRRQKPLRAGIHVYVCAYVVHTAAAQIIEMLIYRPVP